jgi:hypothetical protein
MSSQLKGEFHVRRKKFHGFSGVASLFEDENGDQVCVVCADADILFEKLKQFMPTAKVAGAKFQNVTIIQAK